MTESESPAPKGFRQKQVTRMEQNITAKDLLILSVVIVVLLLLGVLSRNWLQADSAHQSIVLTADPLCNPVNKSCAVSDSALTIALTLGERVQPLAPFRVLVGLTGEKAAQVKTVAVYFTMADMDMGFNRFDLQQQANETWQGSAILPVCTAGRQDWRVTVNVAADPPYSGEFYLLTGF